MVALLGPGHLSNVNLGIAISIPPLVCVAGGSGEEGGTPAHSLRTPLRRLLSEATSRDAKNEMTNTERERRAKTAPRLINQVSMHRSVDGATSVDTFEHYQAASQNANKDTYRD